MKSLLRILPLLLALAGLGGAGCARLDNEILPSPDDTLAAITLVTDSTGAATVRLGQLAGGYPARLTIDNFTHGTVVADSGGLRLRYQTSNWSRKWKVDSATFTLCVQTAGGGCYHGVLRVQNSRYRPSTSNPTAPSRQTQTLGLIQDLYKLGSLRAALQSRLCPPEVVAEDVPAGQPCAWAPPGAGRPRTLCAYGGPDEAQAAPEELLNPGHAANRGVA